MPSETDAFAGVTAIEISAGGFTVRFAVPLIEPDAAVIAAVPVARELASPVLLTVATVVVEELQVADPVRF